MGAVATFDYEKWNAAYPEFANIDEVRASIFWQEATLYHSNDGTGLVNDLAQQEMLLGLLTAHIAFLRVGTVGNPSPASQGIVGRVSSASMGPVSVSADLQGLPGTAVWFGQSPWGLSYWQATAVYRTMRYRHRHGRTFSGYYGGYGSWR
jgi:hypothetical protein